jgi:hypothetical protein
MLGWIREKMIIKESASRGGKFYAFDSIVVKNDISTCNDSCAPNKDCSIVVGNDS